MSVATVVAENQTAHLVTQMIEENHSRRTLALPGDDLPVDDAGMLTLFVGDNHSKLAVLFDEVDALDIDLFKLLLLRLQDKS